MHSERLKNNKSEEKLMNPRKSEIVDKNNSSMSSKNDSIDNGKINAKKLNFNKSETDLNFFNNEKK